MTAARVSRGGQARAEAGGGAGARAAAPYALSWAALVGYAAVGAPTSPAGFDEALVMDIVAQNGPPAFTGLFNAMGIWPAVYASLLIPSARIIASNDSKLPAPPAWPFVTASFAFGAFALLPYLAWTSFRDAADGAVAEEADWGGKTGGFLGNVLESKIQAGVLAAGAVWCAYTAWAGGADGFSQFQEEFATSKLVHVTTCDFATLSACAPFWAFADARRRGLDGPLPAISALPVLGPCLYLLFRPRVATE